MFQNPWSGVLDSNNEQGSQGYWIIYHDILAWQRCEVVNGNFNDQDLAESSRIHTYSISAHDVFKYLFT